MRRTSSLAAFVTAFAAAATFLPTIAAHADWPAPVTGCRGAFALQTLDPSDPLYNAGSPAHKDRNVDGWLCYNGRAWKDNNH